MVDFLIDHYKEMSNTALAEHMGISPSCLRRKLHELRLRKRPVTKAMTAAETVRRLYSSHSYNEIARLTGISTRTVSRIVRKYHLVRTEDDTRQIRSRSRRSIIRREKARVLFGLPQKTNIKVVGNKKRVVLKSILKSCGYLVIPGHNTLYYNEELKRRPIRESNGQRLGLTFQPMSAYLAASVQCSPFT
jgi:transposase